jgi:rhomboid protease GluP
MKHCIVTLTLIAINIIVYICMCGSGVSFFDPTATQILEWGGSSGMKTVMEGQWWRLITSMFVHIGFIHILMNMYILFDIGSYLEPLIGRFCFISVYVVTGIFGGLLSQAVHGNKMMVEAGASGAIFGIIGAFFALITTNLFEKEMKNALFQRVGGLILINIFYGFQSDVNMAAHIGGLISGCIIGYSLYVLMAYTRSNEKSLTLITVGGMALITIASTFGILTGLKKQDHFQFCAIISEYEVLEKSIQDLLSQLPNHDLAAAFYIDTKILPKWKEALSLLNRAQKMKLLEQQIKQRDYLVEWTTLNHKKYILACEGLKTVSLSTHTEIQAINDKLKKLNQSL